MAVVSAWRAAWSPVRYSSIVCDILRSTLNFDSLVVLLYGLVKCSLIVVGRLCSSYCWSRYWRVSEVGETELYLDSLSTTPLRGPAIATSGQY